VVAIRIELRLHSLNVSNKICTRARWPAFRLLANKKLDVYGFLWQAYRVPYIIYRSDSVCVA